MIDVRFPPVALVVTALFLAPGVGVPAKAGTPTGGCLLDAKIKEVITGPDYKESRWGILVVDTETGKTVYEHTADQLFFPASVTKLYTCAAALVALGPDYRFETPVYRRGELKDGVLAGDLILVAKGDPTLGGRTDAQGRLAFKDADHIYANGASARAEVTDTDPLAGLKDLARQIKASGIRRVEGDVLVDARYFPHALGTGTGPILLTPICVNDNLIDVHITPGEKVGEPAKIEVRPQTGFLQVDARLETVESTEKPMVVAGRVGVERYVVRGRVPLNSRPLLCVCAVDDPAGFARALFMDALRQQGVEVRASALRVPAAELPERGSRRGLTRVALHTSLPFSEVVRVTLKVSHNLYASTFPLLLAVKEGKQTLPDGMRREGKVLADLGVDVKTISLESGAGGGAGDRVTPRATVQLLVAMSKRPEFAAFKDALPVLGVDGTLVEAVGPDSPARGKVWAKTGTYDDADLINQRGLLRSKTLAGVMTTAKGRSLAIALFVNDVPLPPGTGTTREAKVLGRLCEIIYQHAP
jgi:D-alanyl-D-alanine carboxypeptidase/D-alanyl-D-alanine-endopeptidase (penicillin-binding protein 4)